MLKRNTRRSTTVRTAVRVVIVLAAVCGPLFGTMASGASSGVLQAKLTHWKLPAPVYRTVAVANHGLIYILGGHDTAGGSNTVVYRLDPRTGRTSTAGSLALATHGAAAALVEGRILVFGGASYSVHNTVQAFNPSTGRTTVIGYMPGVRADTTAATVGHVTALLGGYNGLGPQSQVWTTSNGRTFHVLANLPQPVRYPAVAALGNSIYVFGGLITGGEYGGVFTNDIQRVNLTTGSAKVVGHLPAPTAHAMASEMGGELFVFGGTTSAGTSKEMLAFNIKKGTMSVVGSLPLPVTDAAVATIGRTTFLLGGITTGPLSSVTTVHFLAK